MSDTLTMPYELVKQTNELRFGVCDPATGRVSGGFKVVSSRNDDDVYVIKRDVAIGIKASWHSGSWALSTTRRVRGVINEQWPPTRIPATDAAKIAMVFIPREVATREPDTEPDSIARVELDDAHPTAMFEVWLRPTATRCLIGDPRMAVLGMLPLSSGRHNVWVTVRWLDKTLPIPPFKLSKPGDTPSLLESSQRPSRSLTYWSMHDGQVLKIADLPSVSFDVAA